MKCDVDDMRYSSCNGISQIQANPLLSIVIPTYNRADFLDYCLEVHIPLAREHNIQIFISDNASTDATAEVVSKRIDEYPLIQYHRNETNVGPDENFERALKYPQTEYVWLLGDSYQIPSEGIGYLLELITTNKDKYDSIVFNMVKRVIDIPRQDYSDQNKLLSDLGWHMTCLASLVYSSKLIANANFERYRSTYFIQTGVIFEYIANKQFLVHWVESLSVQTINIEGLAKESWQDQTFEIWINRWSNFILSLPPSYKLDIKMKCIRDHGLKSDVFYLKNLLRLRIANTLNIKVCKKFLPCSCFIDVNSKLFISIIAILPRKVLEVIKTVYLELRINHI